jgi:hypothetical protein
MKDIRCLVCHDILYIPELVNTQDYKGEIVCYKCFVRLGVKFKNSESKEYKVVNDRPPNDIKVIVETPRPDYGDKENSNG